MVAHLFLRRTVAVGRQQRRTGQLFHPPAHGIDDGIPGIRRVGPHALHHVAADRLTGQPAGADTGTHHETRLEHRRGNACGADGRGAEGKKDLLEGVVEEHQVTAILDARHIRLVAVQAHVPWHRATAVHVGAGVEGLELGRGGPQHGRMHAGMTKVLGQAGQARGVEAVGQDVQGRRAAPLHLGGVDIHLGQSQQAARLDGVEPSRHACRAGAGKVLLDDTREVAVDGRRGVGATRRTVGEPAHGLRQGQPRGVVGRRFSGEKSARRR